MTETVDLEEVVFASEKFQRMLDASRTLSVRDEFGSVEWEQEAPEIDWGFSLLYASALTSVRSERAQSAILRIATSCLLSTDVNPTYKAGAAALLERTGNHRSVELASERNLISAEPHLDVSGALKLEVIKARLNYSVQLSNGAVLPINGFQKEFWDSASNVDWMSVSAPTSAGKSRIMREHFLEVLRSRESAVLIYVVPTRALIEEVSREFRATVPEDVGVFNLPWDKDFGSANRNILVLTQERLHLFQEMHSHFRADMVFVDEAQSLGGDSRGILLHRTIERLARDSPGAQVLFASPLSSNPELLVEDAPASSRTSAFVSETVTVNQNLIWVESVWRKPKIRTLSLISDGERTSLGTITLPQRATSVSSRIALVAHAMAGETGGNVVYVNGADEAEKVAKAVFEQLPAEGGIDQDLLDLQTLIRTAVHSKYLLADMLDRRVAFHYGNMPLIVRNEIERLFHEGKIRYLVCTSTLLEGVNLPCRTIFMRNPKKGMKKPLKESDFWNLAGRAGRWGTEFQGNVVCIDTDDEELWPNLSGVRKRAPLRRALQAGLKESTDFVEWVQNMHVVRDDAVSEGLFSYLCGRRVEGLSIENLLANMPSDSDRLLVETAVESASMRMDIPAQFVRRHAGISPVAMQRLLTSFRESGQDALEFALPFPEEPDSKKRFQEALVRIGATMTGAFGAPTSGEDRRKWQLANLVVNWMKGYPLSRLIDQRISSGKYPVAVAIRNVMADIETVARFHAPKYLSCYSDILGIYASETGKEIADQSDYSMLLELGVSRGSEVALMSLGLSRTATVTLGEFIGVDEWSGREALAWLEEQNFDGLGVPALIQREISDVLEAARRRGLAS